MRTYEIGAKVWSQASGGHTMKGTIVGRTKGGKYRVLIDEGEHKAGSIVTTFFVSNQ